MENAVAIFESVSICSRSDAKVSLKFFSKFGNKRGSKWLNVTIAIIIAGALGNFIDRLALKGVRDFIYVTFFANFNVADIAITVGAIMLVVYVLFLDKDALFKIKKKDGAGENKDENA